MEFGDITTPSEAFTKLLAIMDDNNLYEPFSDILHHDTAENMLDQYLANLPNLEAVFIVLEGVDDRSADYFITENFVIGNGELASISFEHVFEMIREIQRRITERAVEGLSDEEYESAGVQKLVTELYMLREEIFAPYNPLNLMIKYTDNGKQAYQNLEFFLKQAEAIKGRIQSVDETAELPSIQDLKGLYSFLKTQGIDMDIYQNEYQVEVNAYHLIDEYIKKCFEEKSEKAPVNEIVIIQRDIIQDIEKRNIPLPYFECSTIESMAETVSDAALSDKNEYLNKIYEVIDEAIQIEEREYRWDNDLDLDDCYGDDGWLIEHKLESFRKGTQNQ